MGAKDQGGSLMGKDSRTRVGIFAGRQEERKEQKERGEGNKTLLLGWVFDGMGN